ncbi:hypothetical protein Tco_0641409 [Tanacetum coccineum]
MHSNISRILELFCHELKKLISHFIPMVSLKLLVEHFCDCCRYSSSSPALLELPSVLVSLFNTTAGNPVKKILLKLNLSDHRKLKEGGEVLKLKNFKKDATLKLSKSSNQEWYEHVGPELATPQDGVKRLCLVDDLKMLKITMSNTSSRNKLNLEINDHYNILIGECQKDELKTKDKA